MKCRLAFEDWQKNGESIYQTPLGIELSLGDLHSGTLFDAEIIIDLDIEREIMGAFAKYNAIPVFRILPNVMLSGIAKD